MEGKLAGAVTGHTDFISAAPALEASRCVNCRVHARCIGSIAAQAGTLQLKRVLAGRRTLRAGEALYRAGETFRHIHVVRSGALKSVVDGDDGRVTGFHLPGELVGGDGVAGGRQRVTVLAMQDTELCALHLAPAAGTGVGTRAFFERLWDMLSCELLRERAHHGLLATLAPQERVRAFLASLQARLRARGSPAGELHLCAWRGDIANYLDVPLELVDIALRNARAPSSLGRARALQ